MANIQVPFFELRSFLPQQQVKEEAALLKAYRSKQLILGPEVKGFEQEFADYLGVKHVIGVGNGYDAIFLSLKAAGIGPGDEVLLSSNGYIAAANAVVAAGAKPVFVEPDSTTYNLGYGIKDSVITHQTKAILPVHLFGQVSDMAVVNEFAQRHNLSVIEDFAQAQGAIWQGSKAGTVGHLGATSFYPTKNLGAAGDGGAICTNNDELAEVLRSLRNYGQQDRYHNIYLGVNSRLDELQAALLRERLTHLDILNKERRRLGLLGKVDKTVCRSK